jgi:hypothetical protein
MVTEHRLSRVKACKLAGVSKAALYRERADWAKRDTPVVEALNEDVNIMAAGAFGNAFIDCETRVMCGTTRKFTACSAA